MQRDDRLDSQSSEETKPKTRSPRRSRATTPKADAPTSPARSKKPPAKGEAQKGAQPVAKTPRPRTARARRPAEATTEVATATSSPEPKTSPQPRLKEKYIKEVIPAMMGEFSYSTPMQVPRLTKVVLNIGLGEALTNSRVLESSTKDLTTISGQKPIVTRARKSIAGFKLREGSPIGMCVTLRGTRMLHFLDRMFNATLSRIRDFRGLSRTSFDGRGNYSFGIREQIVFPEIEYGQIERIRGLQVTIATTAKNDDEGARLLELLGMPFARQN
jgi:large subunit ribosomal protein L5